MPAIVPAADSHAVPSPTIIRVLVAAGRGAARCGACLAAMAIALAALPAIFTLADHATVARWSNEILNVISR